MKYVISFIVLFSIGIAGFMLVGKKDKADNTVSTSNEEVEVEATQGTAIFEHEMDKNILEFTGSQRVVPIKPFKDFNAVRLYDKPFYGISGPFAIYAENGGRSVNGEGAFFDSVKLVVYTLRWHDRMETDSIIPVPDPFIAYIASGDGKRLSTNTKDYEQVSLETVKVKYPETSGLNVEGKVRLKVGGSFDEVGAIKGILQAKLPQKLIQYNFFSLRDFGINYKIDDSTVIKIEEAELPVEPKANDNTNYKGYVLNILTTSPIPFSIDFKNDRGRNVTSSITGSTSEVLPDGRKLYKYNYAVGYDVGGAKLSIPFSYKNESYPFMLKRMKTNNLYNKQEMSEEEMAYQDYLSKAKRGDAEAQYRAAFMLNKGLGVERNPQAAMAWLKQAAEQGHEKALKILENINKGGAGSTGSQPVVETQPEEMPAVE